MLHSAIEADAPYQPLGQDAFHGGRDQEGFHVPVQEPGKTGGGVIGMYGAEHQVPGKSGTDGQFHCFLIPNLTNHDHVRVLPQDRPESGSEAYTRLYIDLGLIDVRQVVFDGIFDGHNVDLGAFQAA